MTGVEIRGAADPTEVAVVLALLTRGAGPAETSAYDRWREQRLRALGRRKGGMPRAW